MRIKMYQVAFNIGENARGYDLVNRHNFDTIVGNDKYATITKREFSNFFAWHNSPHNYFGAVYNGMSATHSRVSSRYIAERCHIAVGSVYGYKKHLKTHAIIGVMSTFEKKEADLFIEWYNSKDRGQKFGDISDFDRIKVLELTNIIGRRKSYSKSLVKKHQFKTLARNSFGYTLSNNESNDFIEWYNSPHNYAGAVYKGIGESYNRVCLRYISERCHVVYRTVFQYKLHGLFNTAKMIGKVTTLRKDEADAFIEWYRNKKCGDEFISEVAIND
ncbi:hypothetical protein N9137_02215 [Pseudomonadales bacterium]|nr:hypothetical protein [Pseudomonadales bacterium]